MFVTFLVGIFIELFNSLVKMIRCLAKPVLIITVNSEIFVRILFSRITLKDTFMMLKLWDSGA